MKTFKTITLLFISVLFFNVISMAQSDKKTTKLEVFNFHSTHRCMTCNAIEANTKYTLNTYFKDEIENGLIVQKTVNIDLKENEKLATKFEASGTSLFLNKITADGKEEQINLTNMAFKKGKDKEAFSKELQRLISENL